jgi:hypothetical protein
MSRAAFFHRAFVIGSGYVRMGRNPVSAETASNRRLEARASITVVPERPIAVTAPPAQQVFT